MVDESTRKTLSGIPLLKTKAGPRDKDIWVQRLKEEYQALIKENPQVETQSLCNESLKHVNIKITYHLSAHIIQRYIHVKYVENNKVAGNDWFRLESNKEGTRWFGKCWHIQDLLKYEFDIEFDIPVTYPATAPEIALPELDGKTAKMYRGGKICLTEHFKPLWARNVPKFGIAHAMALGLGPWLAVEIPELIERGVVNYKEKTGDN